LPCLLPVVYIRYGNAIYNNTNECTYDNNDNKWDCCDPTEFEEFSYDIVFVSIGALQLISGFYLIRSVFKVRSYFVRNGGNESVDTRILVTHSTAYILYLSANIIYYVMFSYHVYTVPAD
jgi:hypothetical protein